jgi:DNA-binding CsgD family transcriptional regulator
MIDARVPTVGERVLSRREVEVLTLVARGLSSGAIAAELFVSPNTVRVHVRNILRKLRAHTRAHAVAIGLATGLIRIDERAIPRHLGGAGR